jgi:hypothetical protein
MTKKPVVVAFAAGLTAAALTGTSCCPSNGVCTLVGCNDGLQVYVSGDLPPDGPVTVQATGPDGAQRTADAVCLGQPRTCRLGFEGFYPKSVTVEVTAGIRSVTKSASLVYTTDRPNGRCCQPTCHTAAVSVVF